MLNGRLILTLAALLLGQIVLYFGCECFQKRMHNVLCPLDAHIPLIEGSVLIYMLWFPMIVLLPLYLYSLAPMAYGVYYTAMALEVVVSVACYLIYPTTFTRPVPSDRPMGRLLKAVYKGSFRGVNCAPSLHCSSCYLAIFCALTAADMPLPVRLLVLLVAGSITVSTMTTKQHAVIDAVTAIPVAVGCWLLGRAFPAVGVLAWIGG